jgi:hypothetical protein
MKLRNAYKKAKHGAELYDPRILHGHIVGMKKGGKTSNDKQMVDGVAGILKDVKSKSNRLQLANKMAKQFNKEKVDYNLKSFLKKSKVQK